MTPMKRACLSRSALDSDLRAQYYLELAKKAVTRRDAEFWRRMAQPHHVQAKKIRARLS